MSGEKGKRVQRVQTGVRIEKRILKVAKGIAEIHDITLGDLLEGVLLHAFEGRCAFGDDTLERIGKLREVYGLELTAQDSHKLSEH